MKESCPPKLDRWRFQFGLRAALAWMVPFALWCAMLGNYRYFGLTILVVGYPVGVAGVVLFFRTAIRTDRKTVNLAAVGACAMIATALCMFWIDWPLRSLAVDLLPRQIYFRYDTMFALHVTALLVGFQAVLLAKRIRGFPNSRLATAIACVCVMAALFCVYAAYPKLRGAWHDRHLSSDPSRVTIQFSAWSGLGGERPGFVIATNSNRTAIQSLQRRNRLPESRVLVVPTEKMQEILLLLREEGFFEMDAVLFPFGVIDGTCKFLRVSNGQHEHQVASYARVPEDEPFARLMSRLARKLEIEE